jgi:hypothetical protein
LFFVGAKDMEFRTNTIVGLFAVNRRAGALWTLVEEPDAGHVVGRSRDMTLIFFDDVLALRVGGAARGDRSSAALKAIEPKSGLLGDFKTKTFQAIGNVDAPAYPTAWLPTPRVARAWQALVTGTPLFP